MIPAQQIFYVPFDKIFLALAPELRQRIEAKIDHVGLCLHTFPHHRLVNSQRYRLRVGDYRIIYAFSLEPATIHLLAIGHRRDIYR